MTKAKNWFPSKKGFTSIRMPGCSFSSRSVSAAMLARVISSYSFCPAIEGTLPITSDVTSKMRRTKRTFSPGAGISSALSRAQKPYLR